MMQPRKRLRSDSRRDVGPDVPSLPNLHVIGWEEAVGAPAHAAPPALVDHLDVGDDVIGVKGDLVVTGWKERNRWVKGHHKSDASAPTFGKANI